MSKTVVVTGGSQGIGLEFVKQFLAKGDLVYALARNPEQSELNEMQNENLKVVKLDVSDFLAVEQFAQSLKGAPVDLLINNAATAGVPNQKIGQVDPENMQRLFLVNSVAPTMMAQYLLPSMKLGQDKLIVNIGSRMASIADNKSGSRYAYRGSKAALNSISKSMSIDLEELGFKVLVLHPGWVLTNMGGPNGELSPEESVTAMNKLINRHQELKELFYHCNGEVLPW